jgi:hypothetical protein
MNNVQRGYYRDREILDYVERCGALTTDQIAALLFANLKTGLRKAQERLQKLHGRKQLLRSRLFVTNCYIYHMEKLAPHTDHTIDVNWALIWLIRRMQTWERIVEWEYEPDYGRLRPDLLFVVENTVTKKCRGMFVELDRSPRNRWDKIEKYGELFKSGAYLGAWWVERMERFPPILVATTREARARAIKSQIEQKNASGLRYTVMVLEAMKQEVCAWGPS